MLSEKCLDLEKIDDISKVIALTERVKKRKNEYLAATPHFDSERSRFATESWKESEGEPIDIRRAKLFKKIMEKIPVVIKAGELIVGSQTKYIRGAGPAVDWDPKYSFDLTGADRPTLSSLVKIGKISDTEKKSLLEDANYWKGKSPVDAIAKVRREIFGDQIEDLIEARVLTVPDKRPHGARVPNIEKVIKQGLNAIIADARDRLQKLSFSKKDAIKKYYFLQAVIISCEAAITFAHRHSSLARELAEKESDPVRKKELEKIADICLRVPAKPARTFHEALQSLWLTHLSVNLESSYSSETLGRIDQYLYPF